MILTWRPSSPPFLLMVSSQILAPSSACLPLAASGPVNAIPKPMVIGWPDGAWAPAGTPNAARAAAATNEARAPRHFSLADMTSSRWLLGWLDRDFLAIPCTVWRSLAQYRRVASGNQPVAANRHRCSRSYRPHT